MTRLIDADALLEALYKIPVSQSGLVFRLQTIHFIENAPTVQREGWVSVPIEVLNSIKNLPRYSFLSPQEGGVRRWENSSGDWIERYEVIKLIDDYIPAAPKE